MVYKHNQGLVKDHNNRLALAITAIVLVIAMTAGAMVFARLQANAAPAQDSGPGSVAVGVDASTWVSGSPSGVGLIPIGGSGQVNGEFTTAERLGIQIGLRAQERGDGTIDATPNSNSKVGIYAAETGLDEGSDTLAKWNYDWHVDIRGAKGVAKGTTLADYDLTLSTDIATSTLFGAPLPLNLGGVVPGNTVLYQQSLNPKQGNAPFNPSAEGTYNFTLTLTPKTFKNPPLSVTIQVNVSAPEL